MADRKTEPFDKDINVRSKTEPRGCDADCNEDCTECAKEWQDWKDQMWAEAVIEPQYDFGEYADRLWKIAYERGKREALEQTEPQTELFCKYKGGELVYHKPIEDEPQTECGTCKHNKLEWFSEKCDECSKAHSNYEPQTEKSE